ncbi:MAG: hypothetical protein KC456_11600 [Flavobacteriales bacterium]|jgi:hypothetical protein|nr:hypothetical protein [Flavobacteriales bacterium]
MPFLLVNKRDQLQAHSASLYALAPGRSVGTLFSAGADNVVAEWNLETGEPNPFAIKTERTVYSLLNIDRKRLVIGTITGGMHVIDLETRQEIRLLQFHEKGIFHMLAIEAANQIVCACADGSISVWNSTDWSLERHIQCTSEKVRRLALSPDGGLLATACGDGHVRIFETNEFRLVYDLEAHEDGANSVAFLPNGDLLSGGKDAMLCRWSVEDGFTRTINVPAHNFAIYDIVVTPTFVGTMSRDKTVKIWNPDDLSSPTRLDRAKAGGHINSVNAGIWLEEEQLLATCGDDRSIITWQSNS